MTKDDEVLFVWVIEQQKKNCEAAVNLIAKSGFPQQSAGRELERLARILLRCPQGERVTNVDVQVDQPGCFHDCGDDNVTPI